jgi:hypothetical protein
VPGHIIFTTATVQQPHERLILIYTLASIGSRWRPIGQLSSNEHASIRDFDLDLSDPTIAAVVERLEQTDSLSRNAVQSRIFGLRPDPPHLQMTTLHPNPIRDNAYKLMISVSDGQWGNKSGFADSLRQRLGRQKHGAKSVLFTYRLIVGSPLDYSLSWTRVSAVPAVPNIIPPISYAGYAVIWADRYTRDTQVVDVRLPRPRRNFLTGWAGQAIREVVVLPRGSGHVNLSWSAEAVISVEDQHITISHYA